MASAHPEPLSASQRSQQHHTPSIYAGGPQICPPQSPDTVYSKSNRLAKVIKVAMRDFNTFLILK